MLAHTTIEKSAPFFSSIIGVRSSQQLLHLLQLAKIKDLRILLACIKFIALGKLPLRDPKADKRKLLRHKEHLRGLISRWPLMVKLPK